MKAFFESEKNGIDGDVTWITLVPETQKEAARLIHLEQNHKKRGIEFLSYIFRDGESTAYFMIRSKKGKV